MFESMFQLGVPVIEKILRTVLVYFALMIGLRLAGKREMAQLNAMDLVVLLMLANTVQNAIIGDDNSLIGGLLGAAALLILNYLIVRFLFRHERIDRIVEGEPDVLIEGGKIRHDRLTKELLTLSELEIAAHKQGFGSLDEVDRAVLETGGVISFIGKKPAPEAERQEQLLSRLEAMARELSEIKQALAAPQLSA